MKVIGFTGMPGSGKSEAMSVATQRGFPVVRMGDLIWEEVDAQGLPRDAQHVGEVANAMRQSHGDDIWALRTVQRIREVAKGAEVVLIDGIRSNHEVAVFRRELGTEFVLVAIHTEASARHHRMTSRARDDDPTGDDAKAGHDARDDRELGWGIARTIALADRMVVNDGTLDKFHKDVAALLDALQR